MHDYMKMLLGESSIVILLDDMIFETVVPFLIETYLTGL